MTPTRPMNLALNLTLALAFCLVALSLPAAETPGPEEIQARMKANLPAIDKLKKAGRVGENRRAYLEARADLSETEKRLIKTENEDRKAIYQILADRAKATLESVEATRAAQIRERSAPGLWLQDPAGDWYRKPSAPPARSP